jgi:hypothetical protein
MIWQYQCAYIVINWKKHRPSRVIQDTVINIPRWPRTPFQRPTTKPVRSRTLVVDHIGRLNQRSVLLHLNHAHASKLVNIASVEPSAPAPLHMSSSQKHMWPVPVLSIIQTWSTINRFICSCEVHVRRTTSYAGMKEIQKINSSSYCWLTYTPMCRCIDALVTAWPSKGWK